MALRQRALSGLLRLSSRPALAGCGSRAWAAPAAASVQRALLTKGPASTWVLRGLASSTLPPHTELAMPALSPTMNSGNIVSWQKAAGDAVTAGDVYCEVETDKSTMEWEAQEEGFVAKILVPDGSKNVSVGTCVAIIVEDEKDVQAFADYQGPGGSAEPKDIEANKPRKKAPAKAPSKGASFPAHEVLSMPALSPTMSAGTIVSWAKAEGDSFGPGDVLAQVETDKSTMDWEAQEEGVIAKILVPAGSAGVAVGTPVFVSVEPGADVAAFKDFAAADAGGAEPEPEPEPNKEAKKAAAPKAPAPKAAPAQAQASGARVKASPYAKRLAREAGVSLRGVIGSGEGGRVTGADVAQAVRSGSAQAEGAGAGEAGEAASYEDVPHSQIRRVTAQRLLESKQTVPHYYLSAAVRMDALSRARKDLNAHLATQSGPKLSVNDLVIKAAAMALKAVPGVNASWHDDFVRQYEGANVSVAVQTPRGLMVPTVKDADLLGLREINAAVKDLAGRAKEGKLRPEEMSGGTFTVSNLGMFGVNSFAAIINPPQAAILAVGASEKRVVADGKGGFQEAEFMTVTLSCDHRVVDGAMGAQWLQAFKQMLEQPATMLL